jgi:hypothetical protein
MTNKIAHVDQIAISMHSRTNMTARYISMDQNDDLPKFNHLLLNNTHNIPLLSYDQKLVNYHGFPSS